MCEFLGHLCANVLVVLESVYSLFVVCCRILLKRTYIYSGKGVCDVPAFSCVLYYYLYLLTCQSHHMTMAMVSQPGQNQCILLGQ